MKRTAPKSWAKYTTCTWQAALKSWSRYSTDKVGRVKHSNMVTWCYVTNEIIMNCTNVYKECLDPIIISYKITTCPYIKYRIPRILLTIDLPSTKWSTKPMGYQLSYPFFFLFYVSTTSSLSTLSFPYSSFHIQVPSKFLNMLKNVSCISSTKTSKVAQLAAHQLVTPKVSCSNPGKGQLLS